MVYRVHELGHGDCWVPRVARRIEPRHLVLEVRREVVLDRVGMGPAERAHA